MLHTHSFINHRQCIMFFSKYFSCPCQYHSTNAPYSFIHLPPTLYNVFLQVLQFPLSVSFHQYSLLIQSLSVAQYEHIICKHLWLKQFSLSVSCTRLNNFVYFVFFLFLCVKSSSHLICLPAVCFKSSLLFTCCHIIFISTVVQAQIYKNISNCFVLYFCLPHSYKIQT